MREETKKLLTAASELNKSAAPLPCYFVSGATGSLYSKFNQCLLIAQTAETWSRLPKEPAEIGGYPLQIVKLYTFNQCKERGWTVKKGSKSIFVTYGGDEATGRVKVQDDQLTIDRESNKAYSARFFNLFSLDCIDTEPQQKTTN